ncbi:hypothetical protein BZZ08_07421 [Streptomyces sp. MH60]|nr:hypothetical protein BZZ08_07421 [Streptomyces sp. MH60]
MPRRRTSRSSAVTVVRASASRSLITSHRNREEPAPLWWHATRGSCGSWSARWMVAGASGWPISVSDCAWKASASSSVRRSPARAASRAACAAS